MKVLVINGSPKGGKSNTLRLTSAFVEGLGQEAGRCGDAVELRELQVNQLQIKPCLGCFSCWSKTPGRCCIPDDMQAVMDALLWADVTVWSFPLYYFSVPGGLKTLIDRQLPMNLPFMAGDAESGGHPSRYDMSGKRQAVISTCGFYTARGNYDGVVSLFDHQYGAGNYAAIFCGQGELFRVPELAERTRAYLDTVRQAGREFYHGGIAHETQAALEELLFPRDVYERMADASWGVEQAIGEQENEALIFTRQMAALYQASSYTGKDVVLEMCYTDIGKQYQILLDARGSHVLTDGSRAYTTRIETPYTLWKDIAAGKIRGEDALMQQRYKVKGDFNLMLHWDDYFGSGKGKASQRPGAGPESPGKVHAPQKGTNMNALLLPWIVFWVAAAIDGFWGAVFSIAACVLAPLLFFRNQRTIYDLLSGALVAGFSLALFLGAGARLVVPLSYLSFGIMWTASCFTKIPLSAHYSMYQYNGEQALQNPLFMKTNWILTLLWGILYLLTPVWTYVIMGTKLAALTGAINSVLPALMGVFTAWFQKWYPARVARG